MATDLRERLFPMNFSRLILDSSRKSDFVFDGQSLLGSEVPHNFYAWRFSLSLTVTHKMDAKMRERTS